MNRWRRKTITVPLTEPDQDGFIPVTVSALVRGNMAVHNRVFAQNIEQVDLWDVTHIPTGSIVCTANTEQDAKEAAKRLSLAALPWPTSVDMPEHDRRVLRSLVVSVLKDLTQADRVWVRSVEA